MSLIHKDAPEGVSQNLMLFSLPAVDTCIDRVQITEYRPLSQLSDIGPIEFHIPSTDKTYKALHESSLRVKARILKLNGALLTAEDDVTFINIPLQTMFSQIDVFVQGQIISSMDNNQAYRGYIQTLLHYGLSAQSGQLTSQLWYYDTPDYFNSPGVKEGNKGLSIRNTFSRNSQIVDLEGPLHTDLMSIDRYILNGVDIKFNLQRASNAFCLMSNEPNYKVEILEAVLRVPHIYVSSSLMIAHARILQTHTAKYPMKKTIIKTETLTLGSNSFVKDDLFEGKIPNRLAIGLIDNGAYAGNYAKNPLLFDHFYMNYLNVSVNGDPLNSQPLKPSFTTGSSGFVSNFLTLFKGMGQYRADGGVAIDRDAYDGGYCLNVFNLVQNPDVIGSNLIKGGSLRVEVQFAKALESTVTLLLYGEFSSLLQLDHTRAISIQ